MLLLMRHSVREIPYKNQSLTSVRQQRQSRSQGQSVFMRPHAVSRFNTERITVKCSLVRSSRPCQVKAISKAIRICTGHLPAFEQIWTGTDCRRILDVWYATCTLRNRTTTHGCCGELCHKSAQQIVRRKT
jgi:hypothetical protein